MLDLSQNPNPDKLALLRTGDLVRQRLNADPALYRVPVEQAEIWTRSAFLTEEECDRLVAMIDAVAFPSDVLGHGYSEVMRSSSSANLDCEDPLVQTIEQRIDDLLGLPHEWGESVQGQRYLPGQEFKEHLDTFWTLADYWKDEAIKGGQRSFTAMVYLSEVKAGGDTHFPTLRATIPPQKGVILIWNNARPDGSLNEATLHAGLPVEEGSKYIITKWYRTRPWG